MLEINKHPAKIWSLDRRQNLKKYNSIVNWLMARKAEKSKKKEEINHIY